MVRSATEVHLDQAMPTRRRASPSDHSLRTVARGPEATIRASVRVLESCSPGGRRSGLHPRARPPLVRPPSRARPRQRPVPPHSRWCGPRVELQHRLRPLWRVVVPAIWTRSPVEIKTETSCCSPEFRTRAKSLPHSPTATPPARPDSIQFNHASELPQEPQCGRCARWQWLDTHP